MKATFLFDKTELFEVMLALDLKLRINHLIQKVLKKGKSVDLMFFMGLFFFYSLGNYQLAENIEDQIL